MGWADCQLFLTLVALCYSENEKDQDSLLYAIHAIRDRIRVPVISLEEDFTKGEPVPGLCPGNEAGKLLNGFPFARRDGIKLALCAVDGLSILLEGTGIRGFIDSPNISNLDVDSRSESMRILLLEVRTRLVAIGIDDIILVIDPDSLAGFYEGSNPSLDYRRGEVEERFYNSSTKVSLIHAILDLCNDLGIPYVEPGCTKIFDDQGNESDETFPLLNGEAMCGYLVKNGYNGHAVIVAFSRDNDIYFSAETSVFFKRINEEGNVCGLFKRAEYLRLHNLVLSDIAFIQSCSRTNDNKFSNKNNRCHTDKKTIITALAEYTPEDDFKLPTIPPTPTTPAGTKRYDKEVYERKVKLAEYLIKTIVFVRTTYFINLQDQERRSNTIEIFYNKVSLYQDYLDEFRARNNGDEPDDQARRDMIYFPQPPNDFDTEEQGHLLNIANHILWQLCHVFEDTERDEFWAHCHYLNECMLH